MKKQNILFVCTGNTCRSIMAQAIFLKLKEELFPDLSLEPDSAGIAVSDHLAPSREAIFCLAKRGIDITTYQPKMVTDQIIQNSSLVLAMTNQQMDYLKEHFLWAREKIYLFRLFCQQKNYMKDEEIEDPYGRGIFFYEDICKILTEDLKKLIYYFKEEGKNE
ncbi:MAG TPA: hypothetical protein PK111_02915 [Atribacterota bacterium]|nr:hypothetical protein [Atribacterota bacterium]HPK86606.1 hypothetical protein [Atribacterota bacterium]